MKRKNHAKQIYAIVGLGRFGSALALELATAGEEIMVLDRDEDKVRELREYTENAFVVHSLDRKVLEETGIQNCDVAVVCISEQMDSSILTTLHLVNMGVPKVISKAASSEHGEILTKLGAEVVYPERDMGVRLAHRLLTAQTLDFVQLSERLTITKMLVPGRIVGKSVQEVNLRHTVGVNILAVENEGSLNEIISPDYRFRRGDILYVSTSRDNLQRFSDWAERE